MSNFGLSCDVCGREVQGYTLVNSMKFCAKCYQETFGNKNMTENLNNMYEAYLKILNEKDQRIAELEEQLKNLKEKYVSMINENVIAFDKLEKELANSIRPKFKIGQEVYLIDDCNTIIPFEIDQILITENGCKLKSVDWEEWFEEDECFISRKEALAKLEELKGENK